jgi:hypothetical protein
VALRDRRLPELALFALAAVLHTWPLASAPGTWTRVGSADTALNPWAIAWVGITVDEGIPQIYDRVAAMPDIVLAEMPFPPRRSIQDNEPSVLYPAWHLKPLLNGYSGFTPASYATHEAIMRLLPMPDSVRSLRANGVTHVLVHQRLVPPDLLTLCADSSEITLLADKGDEVLYSLVRGER